MLIARRLPQSDERNSFNWGTILLTLGVIAVTFLLIVYLDRCAKLIGLQYQTNRLKETKATLTRQIDQLNIKIQTLSSPGHIEEFAKSKLGMIKANEKIVLDLTLTRAVTNPAFVALRKSMHP